MTLKPVPWTSTSTSVSLPLESTIEPSLISRTSSVISSTLSLPRAG
ncbi:hypothetical protein [Streptosporangium vulgare]